MKNYEQMNERIDAYAAEHVLKRETLMNALVAEQSELAKLIEEQNAARDACEIELFTLKNSAVLIKEAKVNKMKQQMDVLNHPCITADDFENMKNELKMFTNEQIAVKYKAIKKYIESIEKILDDIEQISEKCYDTYLRAENLTNQHSKTSNDDFDVNGVKYCRKMPYHKIPFVLVTQLKGNGNSTIKGIISNLVESDQYI